MGMEVEAFADASPFFGGFQFDVIVLGRVKKLIPAGASLFPSLVLDMHR